MVFERLAHHFEDIARELGQFVEEKQTVVSERDFAGAGDNATANESGIGDGVMRGTERALRNQPGGSVEDSGDGVDLGSLESFFK
jgi:hypothetical protein